MTPRLGRLSSTAVEASTACCGTSGFPEAASTTTDICGTVVIKRGLVTHACARAVTGPCSPASKGARPSPHDLREPPDLQKLLALCASANSLYSLPELYNLRRLLALSRKPYGRAVSDDVQQRPLACMSCKSRSACGGYWPFMQMLLAALTCTTCKSGTTCGGYEPFSQVLMAPLYRMTSGARPLA